ncbi:MAG TPA: hypothetical protein VHM24_05455, partial [Gemmatimonadaceae bacterium]|nr:hypothetical protein [Gemmatimonadaceae bacterium]
GFADGDPINFSDPFGLCSICENEAMLRIQVEGVEKRTGRDVAILSGAAAVAGAGAFAIMVATTASVAAAGPLLPVVPGAWPKLGILADKFDISASQIVNQAITTGTRMIDNDRWRNVNAIVPRFDGKSGFIRITLDPSQSRVISAGIQSAAQVVNGIKSGRFTPLNPQ